MSKDIIWKPKDRARDKTPSSFFPRKEYQTPSNYHQQHEQTEY